METLSYLGCNAVKINSRSVIVACFENLVQLGRECRAAGRGCYSSRCIIPLHKHSEEFMGHILTWLVKEIKDDGTFPLKATAEQAYSRLRGVSCKVEYMSNANPKYWIKQIEDEKGEPEKHMEELKGKYGYWGEIDYSNHLDTTEYFLMELD